MAETFEAPDLDVPYDVLVAYIHQLHRVISAANIRRCRSCDWPGIVPLAVNPGSGQQYEVTCRFCQEPATILGTKTSTHCVFGAAEVTD